MEKVYFDNDAKIGRMLEKGARMIQTDEDKSTFSYGELDVIVSTPYLNRLMPKNDDRTIGSLTGIGIGSIANGRKSSYSSELSQNQDYIKKYQGIYAAKNPKKLFGFD